MKEEKTVREVSPIGRTSENLEFEKEGKGII